MAAPCALFDTSCAMAMPDSLISAFTRKTGMPASVALRTTPTEPSALAGSRMMALAPLVMAASIRFDSVLVSPLWAATVAS